MVIRKVDAWKCSRCGKVFYSEVPYCVCENKNYAGKIVGVFKLIQNSVEGWECECTLCSNRIIVHSSNLKRQKSCGCVPRHIEILNSNDVVSYKCRRCGKMYKKSPPIFDWCCEE